MERRNKFLTVETGNVVANYSEFVQECFAQMRGREQGKEFVIVFV